MKTQAEVCRYEVKRPDGQWESINMQCIEAGDVIRGIDPQGQLYPFPFQNDQGLTEMLVLQTPTISVSVPGYVPQEEQPISVGDVTDLTGAGSLG